MKTQNKVKMIFAGMLMTLAVGFSGNAWASFRIGDITSKLGFDGRLRSAIESMAPGRTADVSARLEGYYTRIASEQQGGRLLVNTRLDDDIRALEAEVTRLQGEKAPADVVAKFVALRDQVRQLKAESSARIRVNAAYSVGETADNVRTKLAQAQRITSAGQPSALEAAFGTERVGTSPSDAVFVVVPRTASGGEGTHVMPASSAGKGLLEQVFPSVTLDDVPSFGSVKQLHMGVLRRIEAAAKDPGHPIPSEVRASLELTARNLSPDGTFYLARVMGLEPADILGLTRQGIALLDQGGRVPDVAGKLSATPAALNKFKRGFEALVALVSGPGKGFASEDEARAFLSGDFVRVLAASQDFGSTRVSLSERIAGALSTEGNRVDADSDNVRSVLGTIAESIWVAKKNDPRVADQIRAAVEQGDVAKLRDLLNKDGRNVFEELRKRMVACAAG